MKDHKVIILEKFKDIILKDLTDMNVKWIEPWNLRTTYEGKNTENQDNLVLKSELYDFSNIKWIHILSQKLRKKIVRLRLS